jgi:outer membrane protein assembly factor BamB
VSARTTAPLAVVLGALMLCLLVLAGCGAQAGSPTAAASTGAPRLPSNTPAALARLPAIPAGDWSQFDYTAQRSGTGPADTGITPGDLGQLRRRTVNLDGTVDSAAIELHGIVIGGRPHDVLVVETTYGKAIAIDAGTGAKLWEFTPSDIGSYAGSSQITTSSPTADPNRQFVYTTSPDGVVHKLVLASGHQVQSGHWPVHVTLDPTREKLAAPSSIEGHSLIVVTGGYFGDAPSYQGHLVKIDRASGRIEAVFNTLCSHRTHLLVPSTCPESDSAIWSRSGAVIEPGGNILVATGNGAFNGASDWGDSVLELSPGLRLLHNWTPVNQAQLNQSDTDLGSTSPALLPGGLIVQGGKSGVLSLLSLHALDGTGSGAGPRTGGQLQQIDAPGRSEVFTAPAVWTSPGANTYVFVADDSGTAAYVLGGDRRLHVAWQDGTPGTSPIVAGGLLYVYDEHGGALVIRRPESERKLASLPAGTGHWNSPIVVGGRIVVPEGNANDRSSSCVLDIYHLPGR